AQEDGALLARGEHDAQVAGRVPGREERGDPGRDGGVAIDRPDPGRVFRAAEPVPDVRAHLAGTGDEVILIGGAEPDGGPGEDRVGVEVEQPADVVDVQMGTDDV